MCGRFTIQTSNIIKLIASDVGRPISDIVTELQASMISEDAREVLASLAFKEREVQASGERWFNVRIMPYRTHENRIDGVVITFSDITRAKKLEAELVQARQLLEATLSQRTLELSEAQKELKAAKAGEEGKGTRSPARKPPGKGLSRSGFVAVATQAERWLASVDAAASSSRRGRSRRSRHAPGSANVNSQPLQRYWPL